jgi:hypothetical protein
MTGAVHPGDRRLAVAQLFRERTPPVAEVQPTPNQLLARASIHDAMMRYLRGCDRKDWDLIRSAYHSDARHFHGDVDGSVEDLIEWIKSPNGGKHHMITVNGEEVERIPQVLHFVGNMAFDFVNDELAIVETYCLTLQVEQLEDGRQEFVHIGLRYVDRFESRDGAWKIAERIVPVLYATDPVPIKPIVDREIANEPFVSRRDRTDALWEMRAKYGLAS